VRYKELLLMLGVMAPFALNACGSADVSAPAAQAASAAGAADTAGTADTARRPGSGDARVDRLLALQLLAREARRLRLDRDPEVGARLDAARRQVLAQAYVDLAAAQSAAPSAHDIAAYYRAHPESFAHRRLYLLRELNVRLPPNRFAELQRHSAQVHNLAQLEEWLRAAHIPFQDSARARFSGQLPGAIVPAFLRLKRGDIGVARVPQGAWVLQVIDWTAAPLSLQAAQPLIARRLARQQRAAVELAEIERLRADAQLQRLGRLAPYRAAQGAPVLARLGAFEDSRNEDGHKP
jgi:EpsD family peptidyl-prolyl cis-trans isomerase